MGFAIGWAAASAIMHDAQGPSNEVDSAKMYRKRKDPSILEIAMTSRWPVSAVLCGISFVAGFVIIPGMLATNTMFRPVAGVIRSGALFAMFGFGVLALVKFLLERRASTGSSTSLRRPFISPQTTSRPEDRHDDASRLAIVPVRTEPSLTVRPTEWSLALLQSIEWKRFEDVVAAYFRAKNFRCETVAYGPDGGVDGRLYFNEMPAAVGIAQCKAWGKQVGVAPLRELLGVMTHEKVGRGYFCATGEFSNDAIAFAAANPIKLITGQDFIKAIGLMSPSQQKELLELSTTGDYTTPTCASCGIKLVQKKIGHGPMWACRNFPRCRIKFGIRKGSQPTLVDAG